MTKLPATFDEAEAALIESRAVAFTREKVRKAKNTTFAETPLPPWGEPVEDRPFSCFKREDNRRWARQFLKFAAADPHSTSYICNLARDGWGLADEAVRELIVERQQYGQELPMAVRQYSVEIIQAAGHAQRRRGGWDKSDDFLRDMMIVTLILVVCVTFSLLPTRSQTSRREGRPSGCCIVARALAAEGEALSEAAVVKIWTRHGQSVMPESGWPHLRRG